MKSLKLVLVSVSLSLCAVAASAQESSAPAAKTGASVTVAQNTQTNSAHRSDLSKSQDVRGTRKADDCVGPVSYCNIYFGS